MAGSIARHLAELPPASVNRSLTAQGVPDSYYSTLPYARYLNTDQAARVHRLLHKDPILLRCRNLLQWWLLSPGRFELYWGQDSVRVKPEFEELVRKQAQPIFDALLELGLVPWYWTRERSAYDSDVKWKVPKAMPFGMYMIEQQFVRRFDRAYSCVPSASSMAPGITATAFSSTRVYVPELSQPDPDGTLNSEVATLLFTHSMVSGFSTDAKEASRISSRPTLVTQRRQKDGGAISNVRNSLYSLNDLREARQEARAEDNNEENEIGDAQEEAQAEPELVRDVDPDTNEPTEKLVMPFYSRNRHNIPIGRELARQVQPEARADLIDWARYRDDASATVLGIPASIVMPRAGARDPSQTSASMETLVVTMAGYADLISQALQSMLNELYKRDEDEEIVDRVYATADLTPKQRKQMFAELENSQRYRVKITPPVFASIDELIKISDRGYFDRDTEAAVICARAGIPQHLVSVQAPEKLFQVSSQVAIMKATEKQRRQTELEKIDETAAKKPKTKT